MMPAPLLSSSTATVMVSQQRQKHSEHPMFMLSSVAAPEPVIPPLSPRPCLATLPSGLLHQKHQYPKDPVDEEGCAMEVDPGYDEQDMFRPFPIDDASPQDSTAKNPILVVPSNVSDDVASSLDHSMLEDETMMLVDADITTNQLVSCSDTTEHWKPFVEKVASFIEQKAWPFEYMDVWVLSKDDDENVASSSLAGIVPQASAKDSSPQLTIRHVGHATTQSTELSSIFTLYHLQQFGATSASYVFSPGVGLPGRVLARNAPVWDGQLASSTRPTLTDFPRSHLARRHGVRKGLGIPLHVDQQSVVVSLYMSDVCKSEPPLSHEAMAQWIQTTRQAFHQHNGGQGTVAAGVPLNLVSHQKHQQHQLPLLHCSSTEASTSMGPAPPCTCSYATTSAATKTPDYDAILPDDDQVRLARLLHNNHSSSTTTTGCSQPLEALLWRAPCRRTRRDNDRLAVLQQRLAAHVLTTQDASAPVVVQAWTELLACRACSTTRAGTTTTG